jgi:hypothetical protein
VYCSNDSCRVHRSALLKNWIDSEVCIVWELCRHVKELADQGFSCNPLLLALAPLRGSIEMTPLLLACVLFLPFVAQEGHADCLDHCNWNSDCAGYSCNRCVEHQCQKGASCGETCGVNTDCDQGSNCTQCNAGICDGWCGQPCNHTTDCLAFGCDSCVGGSCTLWWCGRRCTGDQDCASGAASCSFCDLNEGTKSGACVSECGSPCASESDCPGRCPYCVDRTCSLWPANKTTAP